MADPDFSRRRPGQGGRAFSLQAQGRVTEEAVHLRGQLGGRGQGQFLRQRQDPFLPGVQEMEESRHRAPVAGQDLLEGRQLLPGDGGGPNPQVHPLRPGRQSGFQGGDLLGHQLGPLFFLDHRAPEPQGQAGLMEQLAVRS